jgi:hypothetical protein
MDGSYFPARRDEKFGVETSLDAARNVRAPQRAHRCKFRLRKYLEFKFFEGLAKIVDAVSGSFRMKPDLAAGEKAEKNSDLFGEHDRTPP